MSRLTSTIIRLPAEDLKKYRMIALNEGKSFSAFTREILEKAISPVTLKFSLKKKRSLWDVEKYAVKAGDKKAAKEHDKVIYGT